MTQGAAQHNGRQIGTTAAPCLPSDSEYRPFSLYPYSARALARPLDAAPDDSSVVTCDTPPGPLLEATPTESDSRLVDVKISPGG